LNAEALGIAALFGGDGLSGALTGGLVEKWLDIELPKMQNPRMDLMGEFADGTLLHMATERQRCGNAAAAEYALGGYRRFGQFPRQIVLYVGEAVLRDATGFDGGAVFVQL
jgi:hypothetical protein